MDQGDVGFYAIKTGEGMFLYYRTKPFGQDIPDGADEVRYFDHPVSQELDWDSGVTVWVK